VVAKRDYPQHASPAFSPAFMSYRCKPRISLRADRDSSGVKDRSRDALEGLRASHPYRAAIRADVCRDPSCGNGRRADKASGPDRGRSAIWRPVPRRLEHDPRAANAPCQIIGNSRTGARRAADENSGEISRSRVDRQNLQQRAPLTLPNGGKQALRRRRSSGCEKKKQSRDDTEHILLQAGGCLCE
jgi:hypothetical protein